MSRIKIKNPKLQTLIGRKHTKEEKDKIGAANRGRKRPWTKEWREKIRKSRIRFKHSNETKIKMSIIGKKRDLTKLKEYAKNRNQNGNKNPNWKGGLSFIEYPKEFNTKLKALIRDRDIKFCQLCGMDEKFPNLDVHHIDYNKKNINIENLIALCRKCHAKTFSNKEYWKNYYQDLISFKRILNEIFDTRAKKSLDYGQSWKIWGIEGIANQIKSKVVRMWNLESNKARPANESLRDTYKDLAVYSLMGFDLLTREDTKPDKKELSKLILKRFKK